MCVYWGDMMTLEVVLPVIPRQNDLRALQSNFLAGGLGVDLLSQDGFQRMTEIVTDIYCAIITSVRHALYAAIRSRRLS